MASTPMDVDLPDSSPANANGGGGGGGGSGSGPATSLNITRTLGSSIPSTTAISDVISHFRPTKVFHRESFTSKQKKKMRAGGNPLHKKAVIKAASISKAKSEKTCDDLPPPASDTGAASAASTSTSTSLASAAASTVVDDGDDHLPRSSDERSNSSQLFKRDDAAKDSRPPRHILSLDYDDPGELLMTSENDETIQIYKVREGQHDKMLLSKKYGIKLAKFTHASSAIIYASTKQNDAIRYLTTHDNAFLRYFEGHEAPVTCLEMHPGKDDFISCSKDNTVRLWNAGTRNAYGLLHLNTPYLTAWDPSGQVFAVGSPISGMVLLYDHRNFDKAPFAEFDIVEACHKVDPSYVMQGWTKLEFANDGRTILLGTKGKGHFLLGSFDGHLKAYLRKPESAGRSSRLAAGEEYAMNGGSGGPSVEGGGDCCFTSDGRYVIGGTKKGVVVWDTLGQPAGDSKVLDPIHAMEPPYAQEAAVVAWNPRFNFLTTADQDVTFWLPDPEA